VGQARHHQALNVVGGQEVPAVHQRVGASGPKEGDGAPGADPDLESGIVPGLAHDLHEVVHEGIVHANLFHPLLQLEDVVGREDRVDPVEEVPDLRGLQEDAALGLRPGVADGEAHEKAVELALGQGIGAVVLQGILGGHHHEGPGQVQRLLVDGDSALLHGLEEAALRSRGGSVDLVGQQNVGEDGTGSGLEGRGAGVVHRDAQDVRREEVAGELDSAEVQAEGSSQGVGEGGLSHAGNVLEQDVSPGQEGGNGQSDHVPLSVKDLFHLVHEPVEGPKLRGSVGKGGGFWHAVLVSGCCRARRIPLRRIRSWIPLKIRFPGRWILPISGAPGGPSRHLGAGRSARGARAAKV